MIQEEAKSLFDDLQRQLGGSSQKKPLVPVKGGL